MPNNFPNEVESKSANLRLIIPSIIVPLVLIIITAIIILIRILQIRKRARNTNQDDENTVPLMLGDNPSKNDDEEKQKNKHLEKEEEHLKYFECKGECPEHMLKTLKEHLHRNANVFIIGKPGIGKTTLAWTLCKQMHGESFKGQRWYVKTSTSTENLPDEKAMKFILLLDGRFENAWTTAGTVKELFEELEELRNKLPSKEMLTIATMTRGAYERISKYDCIEEYKPLEFIDLDSKENTLTTAEMTKVLETYDISVQNVKGAKDNKGLIQKQLQEIYDCYNHRRMSIRKVLVYKIPKVGFQLIASLMSLNLCLIGNMDFVQEPIKIIFESIKGLRESTEPTDKNKYCTLVYASWNWGYVDTGNVDQDLLTKIGERHGHPGAEIDPEFYVLRKRTATIYEFLHETLLRAFFAAYGSQYKGFVIDHCPLQVLLENIVSQREKTISDNEKLFFLTIGGIEYEKVLVRRIRYGNVDIRHHRIWEQNRFQELYKIITAKGDVSSENNG